MTIEVKLALIIAVTLVVLALILSGAFRTGELACDPSQHAVVVSQADDGSTLWRCAVG